MTDKRTYRIASPNLYSRNFGDEVLIVDTQSGLYFSLRGCAVDIWALIEAGADLTDVVGELTRRYECETAQASTATDVCLQQLIGNDLLRESEPREYVAPTSSWSGTRQPLPEPLIERFTDMKNLLLLDPIHDVSEGGWPQRASPPRTT